MVYRWVEERKDGIYTVNKKFQFLLLMRGDTVRFNDQDSNQSQCNAQGEDDECCLEDSGTEYTVPRYRVGCLLTAGLLLSNHLQDYFEAEDDLRTIVVQIYEMEHSSLALDISSYKYLAPVYSDPLDYSIIQCAVE